MSSEVPSSPVLLGVRGNGVLQALSNGRNLRTDEFSERGIWGLGRNGLSLRSGFLSTCNEILLRAGLERGCGGKE